MRFSVNIHKAIMSCTCSAE